MCGIAGYIGDKKFSKSKISKLFDLMKRRGPDSKGIKIIKEKKKSINFFFTRLSILDNSSYGNQPYVFKNKTLIFNGELYNYLEIKNELIKHGYKFSTTSDTEVLIKALDKWGIGCLKKLEGMWAFFFHDEEKNVSYLCRDRFGEKPLFYMKRLNELFFGSEIKFIKHMHEVELKINYDKLEDMLRYGYKSLNQNNDSNFKGVKNVPPGNYLKIDGDKLEMIRYWKVSHNPLELNEKDYIELLREKFFKAIEIRLRSDFPIAFFLSGGVDSNALAFIAKKHFNYNLKTFSIVGTDKKYDESELINYSNTHLKTDNTKLAINLRENDFIKSLKKQIQYHDSPVATINSHLNFLLYEKVNKDGFKVSISGIGCDEIFSGYYDHHLLYLNEVKGNDDLFLESKKNWNRDIKDIVRNPYLQDQDLYINNPKFRKHIFQYEKFKDNIFNKKRNNSFKELIYSKSLMKNRMSNEMFHETVPVLLKEEDMNGMYHSVENRSPFLDSELFQAGLNMPSQYYVKNGLAKWPLRQIIKGYVPDKIRMNKRKIGFNASIKDIFKFNKKNINYLLSDNEIFKIINKKNFEKLVGKNENFTGVENNFMFNFLSIKLFLENSQNEL